MRIYVQPRGTAGPPVPAQPSRPKTRVLRVTEPTCDAPVTAPFVRMHPGTWGARSVDDAGRPDGLWSYRRRPHEELRWEAVYDPTGQSRCYRSLDRAGGAREATAGTLLTELRREAFEAAFRATDPEVRTAGQRWLAIHMRMEGASAVDGRCRCGGLLVVAMADGTLAHVDACDTCRPHLPAGRCPAADAHRFCPDPHPVG